MPALASRSQAKVDTISGLRELSTACRRERDSGLMQVALFCGGRGSASLIRELIRWPQVRLSLLINGYDDGLSTGELRGLVPDMLGPSDFRKNLARLLDLHSSEQCTLQRLLEHRLSTDFSAADRRAFEEFVENPDRPRWLPSPLDVLFRDLRPVVRRALCLRLKELLDHLRRNNLPLNYSDCSLGNLVFAGAYLQSDSDFNASLHELADLFGSSARLINVTRGENRCLVALKEDGSILWHEAEIVGAQSPARIEDIFLLRQLPDAQSRKRIEAAEQEVKRAELRRLDSDVELSPEADYALRHADLILYGPGTQFSSLLPSYRTVGLRDAIRESRAAVKALISNLDVDHDIQSLNTADLLDHALRLMGDPKGEQGLITHALCNSASEARDSGFRSGAAQQTHRNVCIVYGSFESEGRPGTHSGHAVVQRAMNLCENGREQDALGSVEIYVDLRDRARAVESLMQELLDLPLRENFRRVQLRINQAPRPEGPFPSWLSVASSEYDGSFTEIDALLNWLAHSDTDYLVTLTGDGEYRLADIFVGAQVLRSSVFGAVYGSRTQCRRQLGSALDSAYGEHPVLRFLSWCGAFLFTGVFGLLFRVILSDPFTGFRVYRRSRLAGQFAEQLVKRGPVPAATITRLMLTNRIEIAEIPVTYRTFRGFTKPAWRISRALRNLIGLVG